MPEKCIRFFEDTRLFDQDGVQGFRILDAEHTFLTKVNVLRACIIKELDRTYATKCMHLDYAAIVLGYMLCELPPLSPKVVGHIACDNVKLTFANQLTTLPCRKELDAGPGMLSRADAMRRNRTIRRDTHATTVTRKPSNKNPTADIEGGCGRGRRCGDNTKLRRPALIYDLLRPSYIGPLPGNIDIGRLSPFAARLC